MNTILIIEDDRKLNDGIRLSLKKDSISFIQCQTIKSAREVLNKNSIQLILLDVHLPDGNGLDFLKELRQKYDMPIIIITSNNSELDIVVGLELGANDYITKPFSLMVLRARVEVQLRQQNLSPAQYVTDTFNFNFDKMLFFVQGISVELSKTEQKLLRILIENKGATVKREYLIDKIWDGDSEYVDEHALTVSIKRLRDKLEYEAKNREYIKTVYGVGYTWTIM
ncbi:response regulator transcription factor [Enterococcus sp. LJL51]|uniref:response regulator transcription factor n=1 Tax=Enterococcus sp. LJL51 TaxID=3416656 RepID=UPI003CEE9112